MAGDEASSETWAPQDDSPDERAEAAEEAEAEDAEEALDLRLAGVARFLGDARVRAVPAWAGHHRKTPLFGAIEYVGRLDPGLVTQLAVEHAARVLPRFERWSPGDLRPRRALRLARACLRRHTAVAACTLAAAEVVEALCDSLGRVPAAHRARVKSALAACRYALNAALGLACGDGFQAPRDAETALASACRAEASPAWLRARLCELLLSRHPRLASSGPDGGPRDG